MKSFISIILFCIITLPLNAQNDKVLNWINTNAREIENAHPDSQLVAFNKQVPEKFSQAQIFGFGEATHQSKEFFDIKAKFFKYLVENQGVKAFLMEESYAAEAGINEWISGGKGDIKTIANNFSLGSWYCKEIVNLLQWMRNYNIGKPKEAQIRFYGVDIQTVEGINKDIRLFVEKYKIPIKEELLLSADSCANKQFMYQRPAPNWAVTQIPKLKALEQQLIEAKNASKPTQVQEFNVILRILNSLISYTEFVQNSKTTVRDKGMFENAKRIIEKELDNGKAFLWAHNGHINNKELPPYGSNWTSLGGHLKAYYKNKYYSVGFDFGGGTVRTYNRKSKEAGLMQIKEPFRKTYAETLNQANSAIYFIDMKEALQSEIASFFMTKKKQLYLGGGGYVKGRSVIDIIYSESYDAIIFVKTVSYADYDLQK